MKDGVNDLTRISSQWKNLFDDLIQERYKKDSVVLTQRYPTYTIRFPGNIFAFAQNNFDHFLQLLKGIPLYEHQFYFKSLAETQTAPWKCSFHPACLISVIKNLTRSLLEHRKSSCIMSLIGESINTISSCDNDHFIR